MQRELKEVDSVWPAYLRAWGAEAVLCWSQCTGAVFLLPQGNASCSLSHSTTFIDTSVEGLQRGVLFVHAFQRRRSLQLYTRG